MRATDEDMRDHIQGEIDDDKYYPDHYEAAEIPDEIWLMGLGWVVQG